MSEERTAITIINVSKQIEDGNVKLESLWEDLKGLLPKEATKIELDFSNTSIGVNQIKSVELFLKADDVSHVSINFQNMNLDDRLSNVKEWTKEGRPIFFTRKEKENAIVVLAKTAWKLGKLERIMNLKSIAIEGDGLSKNSLREIEKIQPKTSPSKLLIPFSLKEKNHNETENFTKEFSNDEKAINKITLKNVKNIDNEKAAQVVADFITKNKDTLKEFFCINTFKGADAAKVICAALKRCKKLEVVFFSHSGLTDQGAGFVVDQLWGVRKSLKCLVLENDTIGDGGVSYLAKWLYGFSNMTHLSLNDNLLQERGLTALIDAFKKHPSLKFLNLFSKNFAIPSEVLEEAKFGIYESPLGEESKHDDVELYMGSGDNKKTIVCDRSVLQGEKNAHILFENWVREEIRTLEKEKPDVRCIRETQVPESVKQNLSDQLFELIRKKFIVASVNDSYNFLLKSNNGKSFFLPVSSFTKKQKNQFAEDWVKAGIIDLEKNKVDNYVWPDNLFAEDYKICKKLFDFIKHHLRTGRTEASKQGSVEFYCKSNRGKEMTISRKFFEEEQIGELDSLLEKPQQTWAQFFGCEHQPRRDDREEREEELEECNNTKPGTGAPGC
jgi:hypothetical protein